MKIFAFVFIAGFFMTGCGSSGEGSDSDIKEVKAVINAFTDLYADKNTKVLNELFTDEPQAIVYSMDNNVWKGKQTIKKKIEKAMDDVEDSNIDVRDQVVKISGNTAWFSQRGDWSYDFKGQRVNLEGVRLTGVLLHQDGKWKIVQWHTSYPVRGAQQQEPQQ